MGIANHAHLHPSPHHVYTPAQAIEHAFKNETVGLVTREQFVEKRLTIEERLKEEEKKRRHEAEEEALRVSVCWYPLVLLR